MRPSRGPKVSPRGLQKVFKAAHNGLREGVWTTVYRLIKLRESIKLDTHKKASADLHKLHEVNELNEPTSRYQIKNE